jgi:glycosyltransferase involved in cell wall biosynthesis
MSRLAPIPLAPLVEAPLVSVLMSNYNYGRYMGEAIESVLRQTYRKLELIVCDDGSTDNSCDVVQEYVNRDRRVTLVRKANGGQASGYNAAYRVSRGHVICFLDADDVYCPNKLERVVQSFRARPDAGFAGHKLIRVDEQRRPLGVSPLVARMPSGWQGEYMLQNAGFLEYLAPGGGISLRREIAEFIFPLPDSGIMARYGDAPPMRLAPFITPLIAIDEGLAEWRCHGSNYAHRRTLAAAHLRRELEAYTQCWELQRSFLEKHNPDVAQDLASLETNAHVAQMQYMLARLENGPVLSTWRNLVWQRRAKRAYDFDLRWFWFFSLLLPRRIFSFAMNVMTGPNALKAAIARMKRFTDLRTETEARNRNRLASGLPDA